MQQQVTPSLSEVETDSQSDVVGRVVGSSPSSVSDESSPETDFYTRTQCAETHCRHQNMDESGHGLIFERDDYVSWEKIVF